jgi:hypothetical protein
MKTSADLLADVGHVLYGPSGSGWLQALAEAVDIHERQLRKWFSRHEHIEADHTVFDRALRLLRDREHEIASVRRAIEQWRAAQQEQRK